MILFFLAIFAPDVGFAEISSGASTFANISNLDLRFNNTCESLEEATECQHYLRELLEAWIFKFINRTSVL